MQRGGAFLDVADRLGDPGVLDVEIDVERSEAFCSLLELFKLFVYFFDSRRRARVADF
jgi:hypothetical protein